MWLLFVIFIVVPIAELYVIIKVGEAIGVWATVALLFVDSILGSMLMRHQGRAAWWRFNRALAEGRVPGREVIDGVLVIFGGALLLTPGFLTDILGAILLVPPTRALVRAILVRRYGSRLVATATSGAEVRFGNVFGARAGAGARAGTGGRRGYDEDVVDSTARDVTPPRGELP